MWYEVYCGKGNPFCINEGDGNPGSSWGGTQYGETLKDFISVMALINNMYFLKSLHFQNTR